MDMDNGRLATELLHEIKAGATRWFYAFLVMCIIEICTIAGFLWYISLPVDEVSSSAEVMQENMGNSNTMIGVDYGETDNTNNKD